MTVIGGPISLTDPVRFSDDLPRACDVAIIGGGIAGVMTGLYLSRAGLRVFLCEKGRIAGEQSSRNWGWVRQQGRDPAELPIMIESLRLWERLDQELGAHVGLVRGGVTYLADDDAAMARYTDWLAIARDHGLDTRLVSRTELDAALPNAAQWVGGLTTPSDARAEPWTAVPAIAAMAHAEGLGIAENCAVRTIEVANGAVAGVHTERGMIRANRVLLAGGAWSGLFGGNAGTPLPQLSVRATVAATVALPLISDGAAADNQFAFRRRQDGGYTLAPGIEHDFWIGPDAFRHLKLYREQIRRELRHTRLRPLSPKGFPDGWTTARRWQGDGISPFERMRVLDPAPHSGRLAKLKQDFAQAFPRVGKVELARAWAGMIDTLPDQVPVLDETPVKGFFIATGLSGHGFGIGPGVGRVMADLMRGRDPGHDLARFRYGRFTDGSPIILGPSL